VIGEGVEDEVRVTVIATGFGPARRLRRRERAAAPAPRPQGESGFDVSPDVLDVPSFLRDE
jgi:cell division GTPase FtsZ